MKLRNQHLGIAIGLILSLLLATHPLALTGRAAQNPPGPANLVGEWQCANIAPHGGIKFRITSQTPNGTFSGNFIQVDKWSVGTIEGRIQGDRVEFVRGIMWDGRQTQQRWSARLTGSGDNLRMVEGRWAGFDSIREDGDGDFSAERIAARGQLKIVSLDLAIDRAIMQQQIAIKHRIEALDVKKDVVARRLPADQSVADKAIQTANDIAQRQAGAAARLKSTAAELVKLQ